MVNIKEEWEKHKASKPEEDTKTKYTPEEAKYERDKIQIRENPGFSKDAYITILKVDPKNYEPIMFGIQGVIFLKELLAKTHNWTWAEVKEKYDFKKLDISLVDAKELWNEIKKERREEKKLEDKENRKQYISKRSIELPNNGKLISKFADELAEKMSKDNLLFYRSETKEVVEIGKVKHPSGEYEHKGFISLLANRFITLVEDYFDPWQKIYTKQGEIEIDKSMPSSVANVVLVSDNFRDKMPVIERIFTIQQPMMCNGLLKFPKVGYDKEFGSWLSPKSPKISKPNMKLPEAKGIIEYIFKEFCFQSKQDYTNAVAGLLTPYIKGLYSAMNVRPPCFNYQANRERAGKDCCAGITSIVYEGLVLEEPPISNNERSSGANDELRKKIMSAAKAGRKRLHFANNKGHLNNAVFEAILTSPTISDRLLGKNELAEFANEMEFSLSGNLGMTLSPDLANRSIFIKLFLDIENANDREFENPNLHEWVLNNRELIISALYCFVKNWFDKGKPKGSLPFASFPEWASICGGIMECVGYDNPCVSDKEMLGISSDNESADMKALFEICFENKPEEWMKKRDVVRMIHNDGDELFSYFDFDKRSDQTKFAKKFDKFVGRLFSDIRLVVNDISLRGSRREYKFTKEKCDFDKKVVFHETPFFSGENNEENEKKVNFEENKKNLSLEGGNVGNVGNILSTIETPIYRENKSSENVTEVTEVAKQDNSRCFMCKNPISGGLEFEENHYCNDCFNKIDIDKEQSNE